MALVRTIKTRKGVGAEALPVAWANVVDGGEALKP
jgi:hypothetical protein